jgi:hypothetical protein
MPAALISVARASAASVAECLIAAILRLSLSITLYVYLSQGVEARFGVYTAAGPGLSYHVGAAVASTMPVLMGVTQDRGIALANIITITIAITLILSAGLIWLGPETRGRNFNETAMHQQGGALWKPTASPNRSKFANG